MYDERAELLDVYRSTPVVLRALLRGIDRDQARARPAADGWSIVEVVAHLGDTDERALDRVRRMVQEDDPLLPGYDEAALAVERRYREMDLGEALDRFAGVRARHVAALSALAPAEWSRTGRHEEVGAITVQSLTAHMAAHDAVHLAQLARLINSVGTSGSPTSE